ncbi:MAG: TetR family transcriptional regulator [Oscillospiraceae bacterium]|nr:TetR family transcriptional regulator [Oscillospiraceae bacterium]
MLKLDTKQVLADALVELCRTKPLDKITVQNITDFCGAGRQTFYNHFKDKEELIEYIFVRQKKGRRDYKKRVFFKKTYENVA